MKININRHTEAIYQAAKRQLILMLSAAIALGALLLLPALAKAEEAPIGTNAPHQERSGSAAVTSATVATPTPAPRGSNSTERRALVAANTVVVVTAPALVTPRGSELPFEALVGTNAPRQERNPSANPELWSR